MRPAHRSIPLLSSKDVQRILSHIHPVEDGCWKWTRGHSQQGYGKLKLRGHTFASHRLVFFLHYGFICDELLVRHTCDRPWCQNPNHLQLGTPLDNMHDRDMRGRTAHTGPKRPRRGARNGNAKLTEEAVIFIRSRAANGERSMVLATEFGVTRILIRQIVRRQIWTHI